MDTRGHITAIYLSIILQIPHVSIKSLSFSS